MKSTLAAMAPLLLIACTDMVPTPFEGPTVPPADQDGCNAAQHANMIGQDATALERVLLMGPVRVIRPDDAVTMDYRPDRINFMIDAENQVSSITCG